MKGSDRVSKIRNEATCEDSAYEVTYPGYTFFSDVDVGFFLVFFVTTLPSKTDSPKTKEHFHEKRVDRYSGAMSVFLSLERRKSG